MVQGGKNKMVFSKTVKSKVKKEVKELRKILKKGDITRSEFNAELKSLKKFLK